MINRNNRSGSMPQDRYLRRIRFWLAIFACGLVLSGVTAFPLQSEVGWLVSMLRQSALQPVAQSTGLLTWMERVHRGISATNAQYPFLAYGTNWLAFAHLVIGIAFIGPYVDPTRNKWVIDFGLIACGAVIPLALLAGPIRGITFVWRLCDCSFGVLGLGAKPPCLREVAVRDAANFAMPVFALPYCSLVAVSSKPMEKYELIPGGHFS